MVQHIITPPFFLREKRDRQVEMNMNLEMNCIWDFILLFFFWPHDVARGILVLQSGIEPVPPAVEAWILNHWTAKEVPHLGY